MLYSRRLSSYCVVGRVYQSVMQRPSALFEPTPVLFKSVYDKFATPLGTWLQLEMH